jgi:hypothetical protein
MDKTNERPIAQEMSRAHIRKLKFIALAKNDRNQRAAIERMIDKEYAQLELK